MTDINFVLDGWGAAIFILLWVLMFALLGYGFYFGWKNEKYIEKRRASITVVSKVSEVRI